METAVVSAAVGVMKPLLVKLTALMGDEYKKLTKVRKQVPFFKDELSAMSDFLEKLVDYDQLDPQIKGWRDRVRDMAYDIEDSIDSFIMCHDSSASVGFVKKMRHSLRRLKKHRQIGRQFEELQRRVVDESERYKRYKTDDLQNIYKISDLQYYRSSTVAVDPRVTALYKVSATLVGIDAPRDELVKRLANKEQQLNVISIVGFGGLGKTTLAKEVYQKIGEQFDCKAFVSVSQRPDLTRILMDIQTKLGVGCGSSCDVRDILDSLTVHLKNKRYLIVVDDLWDMPEWDIIVCAFEDNNKGSRVIVTTRVEDVARRVSSNRQCIYRMKPLNDQDSRRLFLNRIFGSEDDCPSHYKEVSAQILKKCGGLPLAIITIASLLASRPERLMDEWETIQNSLGDPFATNPTLEGMRQILYLSYKNLPHHLRTCLLYLGKYPEDHEIKRDDVVRQWMAEGFVSTCQRRHEEDVAKGYFNELVNRNLIQPERSDCGEVLSCRVHDMMLDLILKRCAEDNFISVACSSEEVAREHDYKIRRLSLHSNADIGVSDGILIGTTTTSLSKVRSLSLIGACMWRLPLLPFHKYLRVLDLQVMMIEEYEQTTERTTLWLAQQVDLTIIGQLYQLRYLKLGCCAHYMKLPHKISGLVHLETLETVKDSNMPSDIADLPLLSRLDVHWGQCIPAGLGKMKSLRTLAGFDVLRMDTKALGELTDLKDLRLCCGIRGTSVPVGRDLEKELRDGAFCRESIGSLNSRLQHEKKLCGCATGIDVSVTKGIDALYSSIGKLRKLRYFEIRPWGRVVFVDDEDYQGSLSSPPSIEILKLKGFLFSRVPKWIRAGALNSLRRLELLVSGTSTDELAVLRELPSLLHFVLELETGPPATSVIVFGAGFPALESLCFHFCDADATSYMGFQFQAGVMPRFGRLTLQFDHREWGGATPVGMELLLTLQHIHVEFQDHPRTYDGSYPPPSKFCSDAERALRKAVELLPSRPSFTLEWSTDRWKRGDVYDHDRI